MPRPTEQPQEEQAPPSSRRGDFGAAGSVELAALEGMAAEARVDAEKDPADAEKAMEQKLADKRLELFLNEHDNAGAFKFKRFGREMVSMFEDGPGKEKKVEFDAETGKMTLAESEKDRRVMFVNMGELDRINKEGGGHAAGDAALKETVKAIEAAILAKIGGKQGDEPSYTMLRYRGNEFMVSFDRISKDDFEDIMRSVREAQPKVEGVDEGAPLVADGFDLQEAMDIVNQLQLELGPEERIDPSDPGAAAREVIEVMRRRADYSLDIDKFMSRVGRVQEKMRAGGPEGAQAFFDNYMKKMFQGTELADLSRFETLTDEETEKMAFEYASKFLASAKSLEDAKRAIIDSRIKEIRGGRETLTPTDLLKSELAGEKVPLAKVPERTRGQQVLDGLEQEAKEMELFGKPQQAELARLDAQIETARRDKGTGLLERGMHYENLEKAFKEGKETQMVFVDMGFLRYFDNKGGPEVGDAALKVAADLMEDAIEKSGVEGKAFRYGGDEFTVQIDGGPKEVAKFQQALATLREQAGAIPTGKRGTADGYYPTELVFNYGVSDNKMAEDVYKSLAEAGKFGAGELADPDAVANAKAEIMTVIADKAIEEEKAINRFMQLIGELRKPAYEADPAKKVQVDNLIAFSNKALFAEAGGGMFLRSLAESGKDDKTMRGEIETWVAERIKDNHEKEGQKADLLSQLVEVHGKIRYYERALSEARHETADAKQRNEKLQAELDKAREERQQLIDIRKTLNPE
ncbi:MAG TPA: diguanylate cyclase [Candidatus Binatia bacterium]|nr:diguanylate cyclase [Candidatus Binatia bacterium]